MVHERKKTNENKPSTTYTINGVRGPDLLHSNPLPTLKTLHNKLLFLLFTQNFVFFHNFRPTESIILLLHLLLIHLLLLLVVVVISSSSASSYSSSSAEVEATARWGFGLSFLRVNPSLRRNISIQTTASSLRLSRRRAASKLSIANSRSSELGYGRLGLRYSRERIRYVCPL